MTRKPREIGVAVRMECLDRDAAFLELLDSPRVTVRDRDQRVRTYVVSDLVADLQVAYATFRSAVHERPQKPRFRIRLERHIEQQHGHRTERGKG